jgi:hypothetical protein
MSNGIRNARGLYNTNWYKDVKKLENITDHD